MLFRLDETRVELTKKLESKYYSFNDKITSLEEELIKFKDSIIKEREKRIYIKEVAWKVSRLWFNDKHV